VKPLLKNFPFWEETKRFIIAYSGGLDSHVLLHSIASLRNELGNRKFIALHINHGLSEKSDEWTVHCKTQCAALGIVFKNINVNAKTETGESPEAVAREARYRAFHEFMQQGDCLLTAHHQDDQAETLLIQLLRGAGPRGLAAMPAYAAFAGGWHARPLLAHSRDELHEYAQQAQLSWIDDESNSDTRFDRNFLRHEIMPKLKSRFPGMASTLSRSASLCAEAAELLADAAVNDLAQVRLSEQSLSVSGLQAMGEVRARNLLQHWCREQGRDRKLPTPSAAQLQCIWDEVIGAGPDCDPLVSWAGAEARRYRDTLFIDAPLSAHDAGLRLAWDWQQGLLIPDLGELQCERMVGQGVSPDALRGRAVEVRFRQGGEQLRPAGRVGHHALRKLFQEVGTPPWLRDRIPLLYADDQLLAVAGLWVAHEAVAQPDEQGVCLVWPSSG